MTMNSRKFALKRKIVTKWISTEQVPKLLSTPTYQTFQVSSIAIFSVAKLVLTILSLDCFHHVIYVKKKHVPVFVKLYIISSKHQLIFTFNLYIRIIQDTLLS